MLTMTHHAQTRLQQRGTRQTVLEKLLDFGNEAHEHLGSLILYFDRDVRAPSQRLRQRPVQAH